MTLNAINNKHKTPLTAWAKMVAMAAPAHPHFKTRIQKKSRPIFKTAENCYTQKLLSKAEKNPQPAHAMLTFKRVKEMFPHMEEIEYKVMNT